MSDFEPEIDVYWEADAIADRDEWDEHVRAVEDAERDRLERDIGEAA